LNPARACATCGGRFFAPLRRRQRYCSRDCWCLSRNAVPACIPLAALEPLPGQRMDCWLDPWPHRGEPDCLTRCLARPLRLPWER
jgi:hypothetical protein